VRRSSKSSYPFGISSPTEMSYAFFIFLMSGAVSLYYFQINKILEYKLGNVYILELKRNKIIIILHIILICNMYSYKCNALF
jgi:hypothetical protein